MKNPLEAIEIVNLDHLGIVAGVIDEMELVEEVNKKVGLRDQPNADFNKNWFFIFLSEYAPPKQCDR